MYHDRPDAMSTWEAFVCVEEPYTVLMSGDDEPVVSVCSCNKKKFYYSCQQPLPLNTLALAVGEWKRYKIDNNLKMNAYSNGANSIKINKILDEILPKYMNTAQILFGEYPFKRLDILVAPRSFDGLGMARLVR